VTTQETSVEFGPATALIIVDVQNDFADPKGALYVSGGEEVVPLVNELVTAARRASALVVYTQDWHPPVTPHFRKDDGIWPAHCVRDTWGAELHPALTVEGRVVQKGVGGEEGYSAFSLRDPVTGETRSTELESLLRRRNVQKVVIAGLATDWCVKESALDARRLGFATTVLAKATRAVNLEPGDGQRALEAMRAAGVEVR
jgi:nicotinamidase/pyrazinamidase